MCIWCTGVAFLYSAPAWAYLDPQVGSMILQLLLGGAAGVWVLFKLVGKRANDVFTRFFSKKRSSKGRDR